MGLKKLMRAIFTLPFSAGTPKTYNNDVISHDGSISGLVFLVGIVVILCEILLIGSDRTSSLFIKTMIATASLGIITCVSLFTYSKFFPSATIPKQHYDIGDKIKLRFLWLFGIAMVTYSTVYLVYHIDCFKGTSLFEKTQELITCDVLLMLFPLIQTTFLTKFSKQTFVNNLGSYYGLLILFLSNIAVVVINLANDLHNTNNHASNNTFNGSFICLTNSSAGKFLSKVDDYLDPAVLEYSLLALFFVSEIWPKSCNNVEHIHKINDGFRSDITDESSALLMSSDTYSVSSQFDNMSRSSWQRSWYFWTICLAICINIPNLILLSIRIYGPEDSFADERFQIYNSAVMTVLFLLSIRLFYQLQTECTPIHKIYTFVSKDYLILISFVGSLTYYVIRLMAYIKMASISDNKVKMYAYVISILFLYTQTVFIFQMNNYNGGNRSSSWFSVEYTCLFMSVNNLIIWCCDSFLVSTIVFAQDAPTIYYGIKSWVLFYTFLFPVVVFYRFKCFVAFYELYHKLAHSTLTHILNNEYGM